MAPLDPSSTAISTISATPTPLPGSPEATRISYLTSTITTLIACITPLIALMYLVVLSWTYTYSKKNPRPLNKTSGVRLQRYAPLVYVLLVLSSLGEVAVASWILLQYRFNKNFPNTTTHNGVKLLLFCSCWTTGTAAIYTLLFLHPRWSRHGISSVGTQSLWVLFTWILWISGAAVMNVGVPSLLDQWQGHCDGVVYCGQIRALYGVAVSESLILTGAMVTMIWLAWQSARDALLTRTDTIPMK